MRKYSEREGRLGQSAGRVFDARENAIEELINDSKYNRSRLSKKFELIEQEYEMQIAKLDGEKSRKRSEFDRKYKESINLRSDWINKMLEAGDLIIDSYRSWADGFTPAVTSGFSIAFGGAVGGVWYSVIKLVESAAHVAQNSTIGIISVVSSVVIALESMAVMRNKLKDAEK